MLRPVAAQVCYTVERWADERAATATGDRPLAALGIVTPEDGERHRVRHRFRGPGLRGAGPVPRRVAALLGPPPRTRMLLVGAAMMLVAISGLSALDAAASLHALVELAQVPAS